MTALLRKPPLRAAIIAAAALYFSLSGTAEAKVPRGLCKVTDTSGAPLNLRSYPGGRLIGRIANGKKVKVREFQADKDGHSWAHVYTSYDVRIGWIDKDHLTCRD